MLVEIKNKWTYNEKKWSGKDVDFFKENGTFEEILSEEKTEKHGEERFEYKYKFIGHVMEIPACVLNSEKVEVEFFDRSLKAMVAEHTQMKPENLHSHT